MKAPVLPYGCCQFNMCLSFFVSVMPSPGEEVKGLNTFACIPSNSTGVYIWNVNQSIKVLHFKGPLSHPICATGTNRPMGHPGQYFLSDSCCHLYLKKVPLTSQEIIVGCCGHEKVF